MTELRGPINFHRDRERGILVEADNCPPPMLCGHSRPYYASFLEGSGMVKHADDLCRRLWVNDIVGPDGNLPPRLARLERVARRRSQLKIRHVRLDDWDNEVHRVRAPCDATIGLLPDHIPWDEDDIAAFAEELRPVVDPDFLWRGRGQDGRVYAGFPRLQVLIHLDGRPGGWRKLLVRWHMRRIDVLSLMVGGVLEEYQGLAWRRCSCWT